jgi:hypothetical protein
VLDEEGPLETSRVVARALGFATTDAMWTAYPWPAIQQALRDLNALRRAGSVVSRHDPARYQVQWRLATAVDIDADEDAREVERMRERWQEDEQSAPTAVQKVEQLAAAGSVRLCRQTKPISEAEAQIILDFADELRARAEDL